MPDFPLGHLRFPVEASRGRRYPEPEHTYRNAFQRDRDRVIHTRAFRRLENKTQVFSPDLSDHFRNRLTHTIEVAQIARTVARALGLNEDLTEALALAHDIGHPPFSHAGEKALDRCMEQFGQRFDHNTHALRIVESIEQRYVRFPGLNLTFEVREGIAKHSRDFGPGEIPELDEYLPGLRPPLEAQIIDLADETAYNAADLDDAFEVGMITTEGIAEAVPGWAGIADTVEMQFPGASPREQFQEALRRLIDSAVSGLITGTIGAASENAGIDSVDTVRRHPARIVRFTPEARETSLRVKRFLTANVYASPELEKDRKESTDKLERMFAWLLEHPEKVSGAEDVPRARRVCDFIAGMTDRYFLRLYEAYFGG
jgi:dGTPase